MYIWMLELFIFITFLGVYHFLFFFFPNHGTLYMWGRGRIMNMLLLLNVYLQVLSCELNFPAAPVSIAHPPLLDKLHLKQFHLFVCCCVTVRWAGKWGEFALFCKRGVVGSKFFFWSDYCKITSIQFVVLINIMVCVCVYKGMFVWCPPTEMYLPSCALSLLSAFIRHKASFSWELA